MKKTIIKISIIFLIILLLATFAAWGSGTYMVLNYFDNVQETFLNWFLIIFGLIISGIILGLVIGVMISLIINLNRHV